jgi:hypothetical protein
VGHYTQLVWLDNIESGCGSATYYVLGSQLSLESERRQFDAQLATTAFFGLTGGETGSVAVEQSIRLLRISQNPILEALANLHDREPQVAQG